jgi:hypothetical protein
MRQLQFHDAGNQRMRAILGAAAIAIASLLALSSGTPLPALAQTPPAPADAAANDALLKDVGDIGPSGTPGGLAVWGPDARVLVSGDAVPEKTPLVALAHYGKGTVLAFAHPGYVKDFAKSNASRRALVKNYLRYAFADNPDPKTGLVRIAAKDAELGANAMALKAFPTAEELAGVELLAWSAEGKETAAQIESLQAWIRRGGHLIIGFAGWIWTTYTVDDGDLRTECPVNTLLAPAGIAFTEGSVSKTNDPHKDPDTATLHVRAAFDILKTEGDSKPKDAKQRRQLVQTCEEFLRIAPAHDTLRARVSRELPRDVVVTKDKPVSAATPMKRLALTDYVLRLRDAAPGPLAPAPGVETFPGAVPADAKRAAKTLKLDLTMPAWHSTGLYAPPGEVVTVTTPKDLLDKKLAVRIGCHKDKLYGSRETWFRYPEVSTRRTLETEKLELANPFGGLIYIEVPDGLTGTAKFTVAGCVGAPLFILGDTTNTEWKSSIRSLPGPWAELGNSKVILTVPSKLIRDLDDPTALMKFWDDVRDCYADLGQRPPNRRPERMVVDVNISNGYMHSGYPIMMETFGQADKNVVDLEALKGDPRKNGWGLWHELGHNHQQADWTFSGTTEVTCNLFSLFVCEKFSKKKTALAEEELAKLKEYSEKKLTWKSWGDKPFHGLLFYQTVIDEFGWEPFRKVFAEYRDLAPADRPKDDQAKRDQWLIRFSKALGRNLTDHFAWFGVEVTDKAKEQVASLPTWLHAELKKLPKATA